jgi:hypothetical protein
LQQPQAKKQVYRMMHQREKHPPFLIKNNSDSYRKSVAWSWLASGFKSDDPRCFPVCIHD